MHYSIVEQHGYSNLWCGHVVTIYRKRKTRDTSEVITTMTEVAYYNLHILLCHYCNYSSIAKDLTQGATEVTFQEIFLYCVLLE